MTGPTSDALQVFYGTVPLIGAALLANWNNNKRLDDLNRRLDDLKTSLNKRIDDLSAAMNAGFARVDTRLGKIEDRVSDLEKGSHLVRS